MDTTEIKINVEHSDLNELQERLEFLFESIQESIEKLHDSKMNQTSFQSGYAFPSKMTYEIDIRRQK